MQYNFAGTRAVEHFGCVPIQPLVQCGLWIKVGMAEW
jgi:hypothetical protein